jgi:hypothetical protein
MGDNQMKTTKLHRLYASMLGYRRNFEEIAFKASNAAQDMDLLMLELKAWIDQEETIDDEPTSGCVVIDNDSDEL